MDGSWQPYDTLMIATLLALSGLSMFFLFCVLFERLKQRFDDESKKKSKINGTNDADDVESFKTFTSEYESSSGGSSTMTQDEAKKLLLIR